MDEPVPRRDFVRQVASDVVQNATRIAALSGTAAGVVASGMAGLTEAFDEQPADTPSNARRATPPSVPPSVPPTPAPVTARLDDATRALLGAVDRGWLAVNRRNAGPLVLPTGFRLDDDRVSIRGRAGSAMALAVAADANVTLIVDDLDHAQRCLIFGSAELLEGAAAEAAASDGDAALGADTALIVIQPTHALRMPV